MSQDFYAFIDESGQRSTTQNSSNHFVLSAVIIEGRDLPAVAAQQAALRLELGRRPGDPLHWQNLKGHSLRLHAAKTVGAMPLSACSVVVCKRHLSGSRLPDENHAYLYTLRLLLERLSWFARDRDGKLSYTLAAIVRFKLAQLRVYEDRLRADPECQIVWSCLDPKGGRIDQPGRVEQLQLADLVASGTFQAFEPDKFGNTERRYLVELAGCLYRRPPGPLTSYGLKVHPWNATTRSLYDWVMAL
ncbi:MAG TPA: DUF3800 domain-containing protein [Actinomycetota bacterium]